MTTPRDCTTTYGLYCHAARDVIDQLAEYRDNFTDYDAWESACHDVWQEYQAIDGDYGVNPERIDDIMCTAAIALTPDYTRISRLHTFREQADVPYMLAGYSDRFEDSKQILDEGAWDMACLAVWTAASPGSGGRYWILKSEADKIMGRTRRRRRNRAASAWPARTKLTITP